MKRTVAALVSFSLIAGAWAQQPPAKRASTQASAADAGMVVTGDQEAPLVLTIVPWQEPRPRPAPPPPITVPALPDVLDHDRGIADEPMSRPLPSG